MFLEIDDVRLWKFMYEIKFAPCCGPAHDLIEISQSADKPARVGNPMFVGVAKREIVIYFDPLLNKLMADFRRVP